MHGYCGNRLLCGLRDHRQAGGPKNLKAEYKPRPNCMKFTLRQNRLRRKAEYTNQPNCLNTNLT